jgi:UDP-N-acetylmuramyl pentapeptide phosphotransferase/UDP-N-acetylglucosamine-1-phosphate transferase
VVPEEWSAGWRLDGESGTPTVAGTVAFRAGPTAGVVEFKPWSYLRWGVLLSVLALLTLLTVGLLEHRRDLDPRLRASGRAARSARAGQ